MNWNNGQYQKNKQSSQGENLLFNSFVASYISLTAVGMKFVHLLVTIHSSKVPYSPRKDQWFVGLLLDHLSPLFFCGPPHTLLNRTWFYVNRHNINRYMHKFACSLVLSNLCWNTEHLTKHYIEVTLCSSLLPSVYLSVYLRGGGGGERFRLCRPKVKTLQQKKDVMPFQ